MGKAMCAKQIKKRKKSKKSVSKVAQKLMQRSAQKSAVILESVDVKAEADKRLQEAKEQAGEVDDKAEGLAEQADDETENLVERADDESEKLVANADTRELASNVENDQGSLKNTDENSKTDEKDDQRSVLETDDIDEEQDLEKDNDQQSVLDSDDTDKKPNSEMEEAENDLTIIVEDNEANSERKESKSSHKMRQHKFFPVLWWVLGVAVVLLVGVSVASVLGMFKKQSEEVTVDGSTSELDEIEDEQPKEEGGEEKEPDDPEPTPEPEPQKPEEKSMDPIAPRPGNNTDPAVSTGSKLIALTFDDGPSAATTPRLLDILQSKNVKVTFFVLGTMAQRAPDILRREAAEGHEVASHTPYHNQLTKITPAQVRAEALEMDRIFTEILGIVPAFTRPPYGSFNAAVGEALGQPMVLWSIDPRDWQDRNASVVCSRVVDAAKDGAIILVHDIHATTVDAVPCIVDTLRAQGYEFLTVSELAAARDVPLVNGMAYYSF